LLKLAPQESDAKSRSWITRGANLVVTVSEVEPGATLARENNADEYMVILVPGCAATIRAGKEEIAAVDDSLTIMPPGPSSVTARSKGMIIRLLTAKAEDLVAKSWNKAVYADGAPEVPALKPWPDPLDGFRLRHYPLAPYYKPNGERIQPRVFRCTTLMANLVGPFYTRRDVTKLSPHWHEDYEQVSLALAGRWEHYLRWPRVSNFYDWRDEEHLVLESPSVTIIPATVEHTSLDTGPVGGGLALLYDLFAPPRADFSGKPGFVLNEKDYPLPDLTGVRNTTGGTLLGWQKPRGAA
jgi:hypothetical protein